MKKVFALLLLAVMMAGSVWAQTPNGFNYQAVVRNSSGHLMSNKSVGVRLRILHGSETGAVVYEQVANVTTNENGLFTLVVGDNSHQFANIDWAGGPYYLQSEIDPQGGIFYSLSTVQKIFAVPYAHYADVARRVTDDFTYNETDPKFRAWGFEYDSLRNAPTSLSQFTNDPGYVSSSDLSLTLNGDTLILTGGSKVVLPVGYQGSLAWDSIIGRPTNLSQFVNDLGSLTTETQTLSDVIALGNSANGRITNLQNPQAATDAANKYYVDRVGDSIKGIVNGRVDSLGTRLNYRIDSLAGKMLLHVGSLGSQIAHVDGRVDSVAALLGSQMGQLDNFMDSVSDALSDATHFIDSVGQSAANYGHKIDSLGGVLDGVAGDVLTLTGSIAGVDGRVDSVGSVVVGLADSLGRLDHKTDSLVNDLNHQIDSLKARVYALEHPKVKGALPGVFSISATTKVNFSQGNLQYRPRINTWRFAAHQYDVCGSDNNNLFMQAYCNTWVDLFGYGTSGWDGGASRFKPVETTTNDSEYTEAVDGNDLTEYYAYADWGVFNPIINGGGRTAMWRTMTYTEWTYLLTQRPNAAQLRGMATVEGTPGYVILPDTWTCPAGYTFANEESSFNVNVYSSESWAAMEAAGAVFLPAAGRRVGSTTLSIGTLGNYWTSTHVNGTSGCSFHIEADATAMQNTMNYSSGCSVRLVREY